MPLKPTVMHMLAPHGLPKSRRFIIKFGDAFVQGLRLQNRDASRPRTSKYRCFIRETMTQCMCVTAVSSTGLSASLTGPALVMIVLLQGAGHRLPFALNGLWASNCSSLWNVLQHCDISPKCGSAGCLLRETRGAMQLYAVARALREIRRITQHPLFEF